MVATREGGASPNTQPRCSGREGAGTDRVDTQTAAQPSRSRRGRIEVLGPAPAGERDAVARKRKTTPPTPLEQHVAWRPGCNSRERRDWCKLYKWHPGHLPLEQLPPIPFHRGARCVAVHDLIARAMYRTSDRPVSFKPGVFKRTFPQEYPRVLFSGLHIPERLNFAAHKDVRYPVLLPIRRYA